MVGDTGEAGGQHQQRFVEPQFLAVTGFDAGVLQSCQKALWS